MSTELFLKSVYIFNAFVPEHQVKLSGILVICKNAVIKI